MINKEEDKGKKNEYLPINLSNPNFTILSTFTSQKVNSIWSNNLNSIKNGNKKNESQEKKEENDEEKREKRKEKEG